jgi:hypothetical protein
MERQFRLFIECVRKLSGEPLSAPSAKRTPIGDGCGMEGLVAQIAPLFAKERSLLRWVALRGALTHLYVMTVDSSSRAIPFLPMIEVAMGVGDVSEAPGTAEPVIDVVPEWVSRLSPEQRAGVIGLFQSLVSRLFDYENYSNLSIDEVNKAPRYRVVNDAMALDYIAWSAVALLRTGLAQDILTVRTGPNGSAAAMGRRLSHACALHLNHARPVQWARRSSRSWPSGRSGHPRRTCHAGGRGWPATTRRPWRTGRRCGLRLNSCALR